MKLDIANVLAASASPKKARSKRGSSDIQKENQAEKPKRFKVIKEIDAKLIPYLQ